MPTEVAILGWAGLLLAVQVILMAVATDRQLGLKYAGGPRDERRELTGIPGRLSRAFNNMIEAMVFFTLTVVVVTLGDATTPSTAIAAQIFLAARVLYIPAYVSGVPKIRSVVWMIGFLATIFMLVQALL